MRQSRILYKDEEAGILVQQDDGRLIDEGERGTYILKPIPTAGNKADQMPARIKEYRIAFK